MKNIILTITLSLFILAINGCNNRTVEGSYIVLKKNKPFKLNSKYVIATLGKKNFSFNSGASGTYEISDNKVILQGMFSHVFKIRGDDLVSDRWYLKKSTDEEINRLQKKAKEEKRANKPIIGNETPIGY
jgi:hypothetical protein